MWYVPFLYLMIVYYSQWGCYESTSPDRWWGCKGIYPTCRNDGQVRRLCKCLQLHPRLPQMETVSEPTQNSRLKVQVLTLPSIVVVQLLPSVSFLYLVAWRRLPGLPRSVGGVCSETNWLQEGAGGKDAIDRATRLGLRMTSKGMSWE